MAPQLREHSNNILEHLNPVLNFPTTENDFLTLSDMEIWSSSELESEDENNVADWNIPVQNDLMDLLIKVTATENLLTVTQVQLKVITREISLQQLSIYTPALRELVLDGSEVSSLRDLGCELKNLKVLRLNRCNLHYLDSVFGIDQLEELYAADNHLTDISSCAFLPSIKVIDVRRNLISTKRGLFFLSVCSELRHLYLEGNEVAEVKNFAGEIRENIPSLKFLDGHLLQGMEKEESHAGSIGIEACISNNFPSAKKLCCFDEVKLKGLPYHVQSLLNHHQRGGQWTNICQKNRERFRTKQLDKTLQLTEENHLNLIPTIKSIRVNE